MQSPAVQAASTRFSKDITNPGKKLRRRWAVLAAAVLGVAVAGCDMQKLESPTVQADHDVDQALANSRAALEKGTPASADEAVKALKQAATVPGASNAARALAKGELADAEFAHATNTLLEVDQDELTIERLLWEIGQIGTQVKRTTDTVATLRATNDPDVDPTKRSIDAIDAEHKAIEQKQAEVAKQIADLTAEVAKRQGEIDALRKEQTTTAESAESLAERAGRANTRQSVDTFVKATEARAKAGALAAQADAAAAQLEPFQRDLALARGQAAVWDVAAKELEQNKKTLQDQWAKLNTEQITPQEQAAQAMAKALTDPNAGGLQPPKGTPKSRADELADRVKRVDAKRDEAAKTLKDAIVHYKEASDAAGSLYKEMGDNLNNDHLRDSPLKVAWKTMQQLYNQLAYRAQKGAAESELGGLYTGAAQELRNRVRLAGIVQPALQVVKVDVPAPLAPPDLQAQLDQAQKDGKAAYEASDKTLETTRNGPAATAEIKRAAHVTEAMTAYGLYQLTQDPALYNAAKQKADSAEGDSKVDLPPGPLTAADLERPAPMKVTAPRAAPAAPAAAPATPAGASKVFTPPVDGTTPAAPAAPATPPADGTTPPAPGTATPPATPPADATPPAAPGTATPPADTTPPATPAAPGTATPPATPPATPGQ